MGRPSQLKGADKEQSPLLNGHLEGRTLKEVDLEKFRAYRAEGSHRASLALGPCLSLAILSINVEGKAVKTLEGIGL